MIHSFWKQSGAVIHEQKIEETKQKKEKSKRSAVDFRGLYRLENAYGSLIFGEQDRRCTVMALRKTPYQENSLENSRKQMEEEHIQVHKCGRSLLWTDTHFQKESAAVYQEKEAATSPEMVFRRLRNAIAEKEQQTFSEMLPPVKEIEKKVLMQLKAVQAESAEKEQENDLEKKQDLPLFSFLRDETDMLLEDPSSSEDEEERLTRS